MKQDKAQQAARDEKLDLTKDRVKIVKSNLRMDPTLTQKEETYQVILDIIKNTPCYNAFLITADVPILDIFPRVQNQAFTMPPSHDSLMDFLLDLGYKGPLKHISEMFVDHMYQQWRTLGAIINKCLLRKTSNNDRLRPLRIEILWGIYDKANVDYVALIWEDLQYQINNGQSKVRNYTLITNDIKNFEAYKTFIGLSTGLIPPKIGRGKGAQGTKATVIPKKATSASKKKKQKKKVTICIELLSDATQLEIDIQKAIKASRCESRFKHQYGGSSEGAGLGPKVPDESKDKSEAQDDLEEWGSTDDETFLFDDKDEKIKDIPWKSIDDDVSEDDDEEDESIMIRVKGVAEINIDEEAKEENTERVEEQKDDKELKADEEQKGDDQAGDE
ncbi:hypothetical protein Tco_0768459 [Tanacetum coccineum]